MLQGGGYDRPMHARWRHSGTCQRPRGHKSTHPLGVGMKTCCEDLAAKKKEKNGCNGVSVRVTWRQWVQRQPSKP